MYRKIIFKHAFFIALFAVFIALTLNILCIHGDSGQQAEQTRVPILLYHSVRDTPVGIPELSVSTEAFDEQMQYLSDHGYTSIDLTQLKTCSPEEKPVVITFDDGYCDNYSNAYPILKKYHMRATIFLITKLINQDGYLSADEIKSMEDLVSFQSHTVDHERLDLLSLRQVKYECAASQKALCTLTGKPVYALSYPNGHFNAQDSKMASSYYNYAVTTLQGFNTRHTNPYHLKRSAVSRFDTLSDFIALLG